MKKKFCAIAFCIMATLVCAFAFVACATIRRVASERPATEIKGTYITWRYDKSDSTKTCIRGGTEFDQILVVGENGECELYTVSDAGVRNNVGSATITLDDANRRGTIVMTHRFANSDGMTETFIFDIAGNGKCLRISVEDNDNNDLEGFFCINGKTPADFYDDVKIDAESLNKSPIPE